MKEEGNTGRKLGGPLYSLGMVKIEAFDIRQFMH